MKTCRFCLNQQEGGEYCEACGSPMTSDFPDPTMPLPPITQTAPETVPQASATQPAPEAATQDFATQPASETATQASVMQPAAEAVQKAKPTSSNQVMYSAKQAGETVYTKNKGVYHPSANVPWPIPGIPSQSTAPGDISSAQGLPLSPGAPSSTPMMGGTSVPNVLPNPPQEVLAGSNKTRAFSLIMLTFTSVEIVLCCATNIVSLITAILAYKKIDRVVKHTSTNEEADKHSADVLNWVTFGITILHFILSVVFLTLLGLDMI